MGKSASKDSLNDVHAKLAEVMRGMLEGVPMKDEKTGEIVMAPPSPAALNVIRQFLKDNDITALTVPGSPLGELKQAVGKLPFPAAADDDHPTAH